MPKFQASMNHWTLEMEHTPIKTDDGKRLYFDGDEADARAAFERYAEEHGIHGDGIDLLKIPDDIVGRGYEQIFLAEDTAEASV